MKTNHNPHFLFKLLPLATLCLVTGAMPAAAASSTASTTWNCRPIGSTLDTGILQLNTRQGRCPDGYEDYVRGTDSSASRAAVQSAPDSQSPYPDSAADVVDVNSLDSNNCSKSTFEKVKKDLEQKEKIKKDGHDDHGRDKDGRDQEGRDKDGRDKDGRDKDGRDKDGYDKNGRNRNGHEHRYDDHGRDENGRDHDGRDSEGRDRDGRDKEGRDRDGFDKDGKDRDGHDKLDVQMTKETKYLNDCNGSGGNGAAPKKITSKSVRQLFLRQ